MNLAFLKEVFLTFHQTKSHPNNLNKNQNINSHHEKSCKCDQCYETKTGFFAQFKNPPLDLVVYRIQSVLPYIQKQLRYFDEELTVLSEILAKRGKAEAMSKRSTENK